MGKQRVIFVMHQMPFTFKQKGSEIIYEPNQNHLAQFAGSQALTDYQVIYVGSDIIQHSNEFKLRLQKEKNAYLVELDPIVAQGHYEGYCKSGI
jgi:trehalose-6-phosphate synthase